MLEIQPGKSADTQTSFFHPFTKITVPKVDLKAGRVIIHIEEAVMGRAPAQTKQVQDHAEGADSDS